MQKLSINVTRIPREKIKPGKNGKYVDLVLFENKNGPDQYGNDGFVALDVTKAEREAGEKGPIVGNWKHIGGSSSRPQGEHSSRPPAGRVAQRPPKPPADEEDEENIPF